MESTIQMEDKRNEDLKLKLDEIIRKNRDRRNALLKIHKEIKTKRNSDKLQTGGKFNTQ